jgi:glutamyl-tRNA reductase
VFLYDIDSLGGIVDKNLEKRRAEIPHVTAIIREELVGFFRWHKSLDVGPTIQEFRDALELIRKREVEKNMNRFRPEDRDLLELVTRRILNKILHTPTTVLKAESEEGGHNAETVSHVRALRELFGIGRNGQKSRDA